MMNFMMLGGYAMWPVLVMGVFTIMFAAGFARKPLRGKPVVVKTLSLATVLTAIAGALAGFMNVMFYISGSAEELEINNIIGMLTQGLGECAGAIVLSTGLLGVAWIFVSVGTRRLHRSVEDIAV